MDGVDQWFLRQLERSEGRQKFDPVLSERGASFLKEAVSPTRRQEAWKYTDVQALLYSEPTPAPALPQDSQRAAVAELLEAREEDEAFLRLVFLDGTLSTEHSSQEHAGADAFIGGSETLALQHTDVRARVEELLRALPEVDTFVPPNPRDALGCAKMAALNQALFEDCAWVHCLGTDGPSESGAPLRVEVVFVTSGSSHRCCSPRVVIDAGRNRRLHVVESHLSLDSAGTAADSSLSNAVCRVVVGEGAEVKHVLLQQKAETARLVESVTAEVYAKGRYDLCLVQTGARSARVNVAVALLGESATCELNGVMVANQAQQLDLHSLIHHSVPSCSSSQKQKHIVADSAECIFKGSIRVDKEAQQTKSDQICRSLLVTKKAKVKAMPCLQIQADDVVCSHGATVAKLDETEVFYLMSRGLDRRAAQKLLLVAFPQDLVRGLMEVAPRAFQRMLVKLGTVAASAKTD